MNREILQPPPVIGGPIHSSEDIERARKFGLLLSVSLLLPSTCNLRCIYCYRNTEPGGSTASSLVHWSDVLHQARDLGAKEIRIPGSGEPFMDLTFYDGDSFPLLNLAESLGLHVTVFTNGTLVSAKIASQLFDYSVSVITKLNSRNSEIQDALAGKQNVLQLLENGLDALVDAGFADPSPTRLGIDTVITRMNYNEIPDIFRFCRHNNILPYITANLHGGRANRHPELDVSVTDLRRMFSRLLEIDETEFGYTWLPAPPIVAASCDRLKYDVVVDSNGFVGVCPGVDVKIGRLDKQTLAEIVRNSSLLRRIRNMPETLTGPCRTCDRPDCHYGCRLEAYSAGDLFGRDPMCWLS